MLKIQKWGVGEWGIVIGALGALFGWLSYQASWTIAEKSGSFERAQLTLGIGEQRLPAGEFVDIVIGINAVSSGGTVAIATIPFTLANEGKKTVDSPSLTLRYHKTLKRKTFEAMTRHASGPFTATEIKTSLTENDPFEYVSYQARSLDPGVGLTIYEPFYASETKIDAKVPVTTKDDAHLVVDLSMTYALKIMATVIGRDIPAVNYAIGIFITRANSKNDLAKYADQVIEQRRLEVRKQLSFVEYLAGLIFRAEDRRLTLLYAVTKKHPSAGDESIEFAETPQSVYRIKYRLLSWRLLFT